MAARTLPNSLTTGSKELTRPYAHLPEVLTFQECLLALDYLSANHLLCTACGVGPGRYQNQFKSLCGDCKPAYGEFQERKFHEFQEYLFKSIKLWAEAASSP